MSVSWFFCVTFLLLIHTVSVQRVTVDGVIGETVILPCSPQQKPNNVYWRYSNSRRVCDIEGGKAIYTNQDSAYKDRVTISESEIVKGNFSISLNDVKESDAGMYTCNAPSISYVQEVDLKVKAERQTTTQRKVTITTTASTTGKNGESRRRADGLLTFLLGCALIYSLVF